MKKDRKHALALALDRDVIDLTQPCLFLNASPIPDLPDDYKRTLFCVQGFRPEYNLLLERGYSPSPEIDPASQFTNAIVLLGRNRKQNENWIATTWNKLEAGGRLIVAGDKTDGIASIRKWVQGYDVDVESFSKFHAVVFWAEKIADRGFDVHTSERSINGFLISPGMFSDDGPDVASQLLAEHFSDKLFGRVCDLGAGWGYLSAKALQSSDKISSIDLFEADYASLHAAKRNLEQAGDVNLEFHWLDVTTEFQKKPYNCVIMNPPFHNSRAADPKLGQRFIEVAASTLPTGGRLLMVANTNLPYERVLSTKFKNFETLEQNKGFKVLEARK